MILPLALTAFAQAQDFPSPVAPGGGGAARASTPLAKTSPKPARTASENAELTALRAELVALRARLEALETELRAPHAGLGTSAALTELTARVAALEVAVADASAASARPETDATSSGAGVPVAAPLEGDAQPDAVRVSGNLGWASAYVFRGYNAFGGGVTGEQDGLWTASARADHGSGAWAAWWGGFQASGDDIDANIDAVWGGEQDLVVGWDHSLGADWVGTTSFTAMVYPLAAPSVAAANQVPVYVEPAVAVVRPGTTTFGARASWLYGVQPELEAYRYAYVGMNVLRTTDLGDGWWIDVGASFNGKLAAPEAFGPSNRIDGSLDATLRRALSRRATLAPGLHVVCTDEEVHGVACTPFANLDVRIAP